MGARRLKRRGNPSAARPAGGRSDENGHEGGEGEGRGIDFSFATSSSVHTKQATASDPPRTPCVAEALAILDVLTREGKPSINFKPPDNAHSFLNYVPTENRSTFAGFDDFLILNSKGCGFVGRIG
jgi:hypothetical protein